MRGATSDRGPAIFKPTVILCLACAGVGLGLSGLAVEPGRFVTQGPASAKRIALTFDDGPGPETERFLELLDRHGVRATFFVLGERVQAQPSIAKRIAERGHELASHTFAHTNYNTHYKSILARTKTGADRETAAQRQAKLDLTQDIRRTQTTIEQASGQRVALCRMPYGIDRPWIRETAREQGITLVNWTYGADWQPGTAAELTGGYLAAIRPGAILLLHDGGRNRAKTLALTEAIIESAREKGFEMVTVTELLNPPPTPPVETRARQPSSRPSR